MESLLGSPHLFTIGVALAVLAAGVAAGWGAARLYHWWNRDEVEINEDFARLYSEGITHYIAGRRDDAIEKLTQAARLKTDVPGLYLIMGNLYRERGLFDRAIRIHSSLLTRHDLARPERAQAHASLGEDFRTAGLVDRAREAFENALQMDAGNLPALRALSHSCIEEEQWDRALELEERIVRLDRTRKSRPLAFIYNEIGREHLRQENDQMAIRNFQKAIAVDDHVYPSHILLGDINYKRGKLKKAAGYWERVVDLEPRHLHLVFDRLQHAYDEMGMDRALEEVCRRIAGRDSTDWRARVLLARLEIARGEYESAYRVLLEAASIHPHSLTVQQELWRLILSDRIDRRGVQEYLDLIQGVNEFADPFLCSTCRYRSLEHLWRCPQCLEWDTFTEERPRPA